MNACACPACGFIAAPGVSPTSPDWHRQHRDHHLAKFPRVDQKTRDNLDELIASAERGEALGKVRSVDGPDPDCQRLRRGARRAPDLARPTRKAARA